MKFLSYKYHWKKWIPFLTVLLFCNQLASAQEMNMHKMEATQKNIFLRMMDTMMIKMSNVTEDGSVSQYSIGLADLVSRYNIYYLKLYGKI